MFSSNQQSVNYMNIKWFLNSNAEIANVPSFTKVMEHICIKVDTQLANLKKKPIQQMNSP